MTEKSPFDQLTPDLGPKGQSISDFAIRCGTIHFVKRLLLLTLTIIGLGLITVLTASAQRPLKIVYTFTPDTATPTALLHVTVSFQGNDSGASRLMLPTAWASQRDLFSSIKNLKSLDNVTVFQKIVDKAYRDLRYPPGHSVQISYDLANDHPASFHRAVLASAATSGEFIFNGQTGLVYPQTTATSQVHASFRWRDLPRGWIIASSFGAPSTVQNFARNDGSGASPQRDQDEELQQQFNGEWGKVFDAVFAAGAFRITRLINAGDTLTLATTGEWLFTDHQAAEEVLSIFRNVKAFWGDSRPEQLLVILTPGENSATSDGTVFTNAFLLHLSRKETFQLEEKSLLSHEIFHIWNPYRMGLPAGEAADWFTEGFTHYYQDRILLESDAILYPEYLKRLNEIVASYWTSPDRNWSQRQWLDRTSTGDAEYALPYKRGAVIALWLDEKIRRNTAGRLSLDDRMHALVDGQEKLLTAGFLISSLSSGLSRQDADLLRSFISEGATIPLPPSLGLGCATLVEASGSAPNYVSTEKTGCESQLHYRER